MKTLKQFTQWFTKTGKDDKMTKTTFHSDYSPGRDRINGGEWIAEIRKREAAKKKHRIKMNSNNYTPIFNSTQNYNANPPGRWNTITIDDHTTTDTTMHIDGKLEVQGRDVLKELDEMRDALLLLKRDVDMESKYPRLKELKDEYERALEKYKTFEALK